MTVVGRGAQLEGTLVSTESIRIDGQAKGTIAARGDVILSPDSHVEADIQAQNVVTGGTLKGSITARTMTEVTDGGRVEGTIRSKALVVSEGALFSGQASIDLQGTPPEADRLAYQEDELQTGYDESVRRAAEWYRSTLADRCGIGSGRRRGLGRLPASRRQTRSARSGRRSSPLRAGPGVTTDRMPGRDADVARTRRAGPGVGPALPSRASENGP
jgi:cytoskeletal protein CcmA (bactofilin family)